MRHAAILAAVLGCGRFGFDDRPPHTMMPGGDAALPEDAAMEPSCTDALQNGDETGIDCGGTCPLRCPQVACTSDDECVTGHCDPGTGACQLAPLAWKEGPQLLLGRDNFDCVTRSDGSVFAVGGTSQTDSFLASVEVLPPGADAFVAGPTLLEPRGRHAVGITADDTILAATGLNDDGVLSSIERLAFGATAWTPAQDSGYPQQAIRAIVAGSGELYIPDDTLSKVYNPLTNSWRDAPGIGRDMFAIAASADGRFVYVFGGFHAAISPEANVLDTTTDTWSPVAPLSSARAESAAVSAPDGRIYVIGGLTNVVLDLVEAYLPESDAYTVAPPLSRTRRWPCATLLSDGRIFVAGGSNPGTGGRTNTSEIYGPQLTVEPAIAPPGTTVTVNANGFAPNAALAVTLDDTVLAIDSTSSTGDRAIPITVPARETGSYQIRAIDNRSQYPVTARLQIGPSS